MRKQIVKKNPIISVAMPVYNGAKWLPSAIDSILNQTCTDFEIVISDNASTDNSEEICRNYAKKDPRIRYFRNSINLGVSENFNMAFKHSVGKYVKWATTNDYIKPTMLERCVEILEKNSDVVLCYCKTRLFNPSENYEEDYEDNLHLMQESPSVRFSTYFENARLNNIMNGVIRSDSLKKTGLYKRYIAADVNMIAELVFYGKFYEIPEYLFYRRMDPESATKMKSAEEVWRYYDPDNSRKMLFQHWKYYFNLLLPAIAAPVNFNEKINILGYILKRIFWAKSYLFEDIKMSVFQRERKS